MPHLNVNLMMMISPAETWAQWKKSLLECRSCWTGSEVLPVMESWLRELTVLCFKNNTFFVAPLRQSGGGYLWGISYFGIQDTVERRWTEGRGQPRRRQWQLPWDLPASRALCCHVVVHLVDRLHQGVNGSSTVAREKKKITPSCVIWIILGNLSHPWIKLTFRHGI